MGKWRNRHDKSFDCKWTNGKVMALGLWVGNTHTSELIFREQMSKVKNKLQFWRARNLSVTSRVHVVNVFVLSRLRHRTEIFSIPPTVLKELDKEILDFVWANKKHEINKDLLMSGISCGGLRLVKIRNKINAQRVLWAAKLRYMKDGCFTKQVVNLLIGVNDGGYFDLDFLKADKINMTFHAKDKFYSELISINNTMIYDFQINEKNQLEEEYIFHNPKILDDSSSAYKPNKTLIQLGILKVKDLVFKRGQKGYNRKAYDLIQEIKTHLPKPRTGNQNKLAKRTVSCTLVWRAKRNLHVTYLSSKFIVSSRARSALINLRRRNGKKC